MALSIVDSSRLPAAALDWAERARGAAPVTWTRWEAGVRTIYQYAGLRFPPIVRVASPLALARALFVARINEVPGDEDRALAGLMRRVSQDRIDRLLPRLFSRTDLWALRGGLVAPVDAATGAEGIEAAVDAQVRTTALVDDPPDVRQSALAGARRVLETIRRVHVLSTRTQQRPSPAEWQSWTLHLGGPGDAGWAAQADFLARAAGNAGKGWPRRVKAFTDALRGGWWWPHLDFVLVSDRPSEVRSEPDVGGVPGRLHCADGPALVWPDGWRLHFWHGTLVPEWVVRRPTPERVHGEANVEVRRCAIEAMGWDNYIARAGLRQLDAVPDPGNSGHFLRLYEVPPAILGTPGRVLLATNGSEERDGTRREYGLPVPDEMTGALEAAAWTYGLRADQYARLFTRK